MSRTTSLVLRLLVVPGLVLAGLVFVLTRDGYSYARLAGFIAAFILTVDLVTFASGRLQNLLVMLATIFFGLSVLESVAQTLMPHTVFTHPGGLFGERAEIGWGPTRAGTYPAEKVVDGKSIYRVHYRIDDDLLRHTNSKSDGPTIAFFGDSFTFGDGIDDPDTLPQIFADKEPGFHVLNLGFSGYNPSQMLRALQTGLFDKQLAKPRLFVIQTGPFHIERAACKPNFSLRGPRYVAAGHTVDYKGPCAAGLWRRVREFTSETALERVFVAPISRRPTHEDVVDYIAILAATAKLSREKYGVPLVVLYVPAEEHMLDGTGFTDQEIRDRLRKADIHLLDTDVEGAPGDVLRIPGDGHPTGKMNALIARKLIDDLKASMPDVLKTNG